MKRLLRWPVILVIIFGLTVLAGLGREVVFSVIERDAFITKGAGTATPDALGAPSQQISFPSGDRILRGSFVRAPGGRASAVLIFHGDEESISDWAAAQKRLYDSGISSLVFDYSGYGASTGRPTLKNLREDGRAAFERFVALTPDADRRYVMGFSLGSAALLDVADRLEPRPNGIIIASGFASARELAVSEGRVPGWLAWLLPDVWNNEERVGSVGTSLLVVHSRADEVIPFQHAERLCRAAESPRRLILFDDLVHDAALLAHQADRYWPPIVEYLQSGNLSGPVADPPNPCTP